MLKSEKEVAQAQLDAEKAVIKEIEKQYKQALDEIDEKIASLLGRNDSDMQNVIYQVQYQKQLKTQVQSILEQLQANEFETISEFLAQSYQDGFVGAMYSMHSQDVPLIIPIDQNAVIRAVQTESKLSHDLYTALGVDITKLKKTVTSEITRGIATGMLYDEIARSVSLVSKAPMSRAKTIVRTEAHRIQQASAHDAYVLAKSKGADVVKQWDSTLDGDTRPTHRQLDGQIVELEESFKVAGKSARYPGDFGDPAEDCNCRCRVNQRAKWALGKDELQTLKDRAEYFGLDKSDSFKEFEKKYMKAVQKSEIAADPLPTAKDTKRIVPAAPTSELEQKRKAVSQYMESLGANVDEDGLVTLYHATDKTNVPKINKDGFKPTNAPINGGTGGEDVKERVFFGYDKDWVADTWADSGNYEIMEVKIPAEYLHQAGKNTLEVFVEGTITSDGDGIWTPDILPTSTAWDRKTIKRWAKNADKIEKTVENTTKSGIIKADKVVSGHSPTPKKSDPKTVIDHTDDNGKVDTRTFYGEDGMKETDLHTGNHGNPKAHPYGKNGEHAHDYTWDEDGNLKEKTTREIKEGERERNGDIL